MSSKRSSRTTTIGTHCTENGRTEGLLVDLLCAHLFAALKNHYHHHHHHHHQSNLLIIIIVVAEGELARLQTALEGWKTKLESEGVKWRRVRIRLIKVAGVGGDTEEKLPQNKSTEEEEEEDENEQTIEATAQALHLLSRPLHSPITSASIPDTTRAEAAFLQYNIARINSILDKYSRSSSSSIKSGGDYISDDQSTTTTTISPDCTKVVPEAAAASAASASANLKSLTADDEWHLVLLYWLPLAQLADELYSQLLLMETETTMTGDSADINDQQEEENHAKTVMVTSAAEAEAAVAVDVCCPVLDVHKVSRLLARLAHGFSVYYRKVKILRLQLPPSAEESSRAEEEASETNAATATDAKTKTAAATDHHYHHLLQLMAARVRLCALIRQTLLFYLCSLLGIAAVQKM